MSDRRYLTRRGLPVLALAALVTAAGCVDTELQGVVLNDDIGTPDNMLPLARGTNSELTDVFRDFDGVWWNMDASTDDFTNDGAATSEEVLTVADYRDRPGDFAWEQTHEAAWAAYYSVKLMTDVFGQQEAARHPLVAHMWWTAGIAERLLGEMFCELVYDYGPGAGVLIGPNDQYDATRAVPADSAYRRSLNAHRQALAVAEAAVAAGAPTPDGDERIFSPQGLVYKAHGGIAQAAVLLGDWDLAVQHASQVPDDFVAYEHQDPEVEDNPWYEVSFQNDDFTLWNTPAHLLYRDDPRTPWIKCGEFEDGERNIHTPNASEIDDTDLCDAIEGYGGEFRAESNDMPLYASLKSQEEGLLVRIGGETGEDADIPVVKGTEMRLIRAEAALRNGDLGGFTTHVNAARAVYGMDPIDEPATAGDFEYPNAQDDAWSILDRERYTTNHLEGRRLPDLRRWNHPFLTQREVNNTRVLEEYGPRSLDWCFPVADIECDANPNLNCPNLASG